MLPFYKHERIGDLMSHIEQNYANIFCDGDINQAVKSLRPRKVYCIGLLMLAFIFWFVYSRIVGRCENTYNYDTIYYNILEYALQCV